MSNNYNDYEYDYGHEDRPGYEQRVHHTLQSKALELGVYPLHVRCSDCGHDTKVDDEHSQYIVCEECDANLAHDVCYELRNAIDDTVSLADLKAVPDHVLLAEIARRM